MSFRIRVKEIVTGTHCWPDAPAPNDFLRNEHMHEFHVYVEMPVTHEDRDVEFIEVRQRVKEFFSREIAWQIHDGIVRFGTASCETIAKEVADWIYKSYPKYEQDTEKRIKVEVYEDDIMGGIYE